MITFDGLVAGENFLRNRIEELDDGTPYGTHWRLIRDLLSEVARVSGITLEMPDRCPDTLGTNASTECQETGRLLVFLDGTVGEDCGQEFVFHQQ